MSILESFQRAWDYQLLRYEGCKTPDFDCYDSSGSITQETLEDGLLRCKRIIRELESELERKRFVEQFITHVLRRTIVIEGLEIKNAKIIGDLDTSLSTASSGSVSVSKRQTQFLAKAFNTDSCYKIGVGLNVENSNQSGPPNSQSLESRTRTENKIRLIAPEILGDPNCKGTSSCPNFINDLVNKNLSGPSASSVSGSNNTNNNNILPMATKSCPPEVLKPKPRIARSKQAQVQYDKAVQDLANLDEGVEDSNATIATIFSRLSDTSSHASSSRHEHESNEKVTSNAAATEVEPISDISNTNIAETTTISECPKCDGKGEEQRSSLSSISSSQSLHKTDSLGDGSPKSLLQRKNTATKDGETISISSIETPDVSAVNISPKVSLLRRKNTETSNSSFTTTGGGASEDDSSEEDDQETLMVLRQSIYRASQWCTDIDSSRTRLSIQAHHLSNRFSRCCGDSVQTFSSPTGSGMTMMQPLDSVEEGPPTPYPLSPPVTSIGSNLVPVWPIITAVSSSSSNEDELPLSASASSGKPAEKLQMRRLVIGSLLESEQTYLKILGSLLAYKETFKNFTKTQKVVTSDDIDVMFYGISDLHKIHYEFEFKLKPIVADESNDPLVAEIFKILAMEEYNIAPDYLKNYPKAISTILNCRQASQQFDALTKDITCPGMGDKTNLEELLHQPVVRFQRSTLVLHDLIKYTGTSHPDYDLLQKTQKFATEFLATFGRGSSSEKDGASGGQNYLAKEALIVEKIGKYRKLRRIFLFSNFLVGAKQKITNRQKVQYEVKWFIPLLDLSLEDRCSALQGKILEEDHRCEIDMLQKKVSELQTEYKNELKKSRGALESNKSKAAKLCQPNIKNVEKIRKKLTEQETALFLALPHLQFCVHNRKLQKQHMLMMSSDYELTDWRDTIAGLLCKADASTQISAADVQNLLNQQKNLSLRNFDRDSHYLEEERLFGSLRVKVGKLQGLKRSASASCNIEIDSFGLFTVKAKTKDVQNSLDPTWNADFEIDLEGAQTLRILCYQRDNKTLETLLGKGAIELRSVWLKDGSHDYTISLSNELSLVVSLEYISREQMLTKYTEEPKTAGLFGVRLEIITRRDGSSVPLIVTSCVQEIERRGLKEEGVYRISGMSTAIQDLKDLFEKNSKQAIKKLGDIDVDVLTGVLKLFFRHLPDSLFTESMYKRFVEGIGLADPDAKDKCLLSLVRMLPEPNLATIIYFLDHLVRISKFEEQNKMSLRNLATVFGPTLLRPSGRQSQPLTMEQLIFLSTHEVVQQTSILLHFLNLKASNADFTASSRASSA